MRRASIPASISLMLWGLACFGPGFFSTAAAAGMPPVLDPKVISQASGEQATADKSGVVKISWPRTDVAVRVDGIPLPPAAGLGSWAAFMPMPKGAMVMGDTVVFEDEVDAAMDAAFAHGLDVTALHNHFFYDTPHVYFMHIGGEGDPAALAAGVKAVWGAIRAVRAQHPLPADGFPGDAPKAGHLDYAALAKIVGVAPSVAGGVVKFTLAHDSSMSGMPVGGSMGLTTWAAFTGDDRLASMDGDFSMSAADVQPVLHALRKAGIHVVALHTHMIGETPIVYFTHFWGKGTAVGLAQGFKAALDAQTTGAH